MTPTEFTEIILELESEIKKLILQNERLRKENLALLKNAVASPQEADLFSGLPTNERMVLKTKVEMLINKIDRQLAGEGNEHGFHQSEN